MPVFASRPPRPTPDFRVSGTVRVEKKPIFRKRGGYSRKLKPFCDPRGSRIQSALPFPVMTDFPNRLSETARGRSAITGPPPSPADIRDWPARGGDQSARNERASADS